MLQAKSSNTIIIGVYWVLFSGPWTFREPPTSGNHVPCSMDMTQRVMLKKVDVSGGSFAARRRIMPVLRSDLDGVKDLNRNYDPKLGTQLVFPTSTFFHDDFETGD